MYESAKQWINAVANLRGKDPQTNQEKLAELRAIVADHSTAFSLIDGATAAWNLHINTDQARLTRREFDIYFAATAAFNAEMHAIYHSLPLDR